MHPTPSLLVAQWTACLSFPDSNVLWNSRQTAFSSYYPPLAALPYLSEPSASASPTRTVWRTLPQISILIFILILIYLTLRPPNLFMRTT